MQITQSWTYKVETLPIWKPSGKFDLRGEPTVTPTDTEVEARLNALGAEGWEVVSATGVGGMAQYEGPKLLHVVLKRQS